MIGLHMNLFATDPCPARSALALDDRRLVKMVLETAQLLSTAAHEGALLHVGDLYKPTHLNHPVSKWVRADARNIDWTYRHFVSLLDEYEERFSRPHASGVIARRLILPNVLADAPEAFCNCTPYPELPVHGAYRQTLRAKWNSDVRPPTWRHRGQPPWR